MATQYVNFQGKSKWAKLHKPSQFDKWSVDLYLDEAQVERFKSYKTKTVLRKDDDGYYVSFSRPTEKLIRGKRTALHPPTVTDKEGKPFGNVPIGNGSDLTITCELYGYTPPQSKDKLHAIRLFAVRVDDLVVFERDSYPEDERKAVETLDKVPPPPSW